MFGFLKKKLKEGIEKISRSVSEKEEEKIAQAVEEVKAEEQIEEPNREIIAEAEKQAVPEEVKPEETKPEVPPEEAKPAPVEEVPVEATKVEAPKIDEPKIDEKAEKEIRAEEIAEERIEEARKTIETAKEIESLDEERLYEGPDLFEKKVEEKLIEPERVEEPEKVEEPEEVEEIAPKTTEAIIEVEVPEEIKKEVEEEIKLATEALEEEAQKEEKPKEKKRGILGRLLKRKPKEEEAKVVEEVKAEEKSLIEKIKRKITEKKIEEDDVKDLLKDLEMSLLSSDVAVEAADKIISDLRKNLVGNFIKRNEIEGVVKNSFKNSITEILNVESFDLLQKAKSKKPFVIVFLGFNGSGKTTTVARIGYLLKHNGFKCVLAAADSFRAASIEQLEEHGRNLGLEVIKHDYGADPAAVIFDAVKHAKAKDIDVVLADTAGRSHANLNLMDELKKIIKVNSPDLKILVLDALTGNDIYDQCKLFNDAVGVDGLIITKADVYEKGGATLSASFTINKPILYLGVGQEYKDLEKFDSKKIVDRLLE